MQLFSEKWWEKIRWGTPISVGLHLLVIALLLIQLPQETPKPEGEQSVNVELVPPPQPKQQEKPKQEVRPKKEQPKPQPEPARRQPQAFESAAAKTKQDAKVAELPPTAKAEKKDVVNEAKKAEPAAATRENVEKEKPKTQPQKQPDTDKPAPQQLAVLSNTANGDKSAAENKPVAKTEAEKTVPKSDPVPLRKPVDGKEKGDKTEAKAKLPADKFVDAKELFSAKSIADPRVKQAMGQLPVKKRILQLCSIEALEQIRNERPEDFPDMLVPFGPSGGFIGKEQIDASGGAYRSKGTWYDVNFKCKVNLETVEVVSFSYAIGSVVPEASWKSRKLPPN